MTKTGGEITRLKILKVAEKLFSEKGFNGTSVDTIANKAGVNKALIYYHFKDKNDIRVSLIKDIVKELGKLIEDSSKRESEGQLFNLSEKIRKEITFMNRFKKIISVMLMESLKSTDKDNFIFQCADIIINHELEMYKKIKGEDSKDNPEERLRYFVFEFFTGFIPVIAYVAFQDKWCEYFKCDKNKLLDHFIDSFRKTHLASHILEEDYSEIKKGGLEL